MLYEQRNTWRCDGEFVLCVREGGMKWTTKGRKQGSAKGRWKKESHMQTFSRLHSPKTTLLSTTSDKMCYDDWEELSVMFEINIQMRIRFSSQDWDILRILFLSLSLFEEQHDLFQLQKQLSFPHKMCLLFVDENFPLCWLERMTTSRSGRIFLRPFFGRSERQRMMTSKIFQPSKKTTREKFMKIRSRHCIQIYFAQIGSVSVCFHRTSRQMTTTKDDEENWKVFHSNYLIMWINNCLNFSGWRSLSLERNTKLKTHRFSSSSFKSPRWDGKLC